tara:strand:- start:1685 stop:2383 length:699 start_codon:yes stop_codon:yes gene_type:complete
MISTKDVGGDSTGGGLSKTIGPGEHTLKINNIKLIRFPFMEADNGYYLALEMETKPIEGFEGFLKDYNDETKGRFEGQVGEVKTNRYFYKDGTTPSGIVINRDTEIVKAIRKICFAADRYDWFDAADGKYKTIEKFIEAFNDSDVYKDKYFKVCVAGKEYEKKNGYTAYDLYFPKLSGKEVVNIELDNAKKSRLISFDANNHMIKLEPKEVSSFDDDMNEPLDVKNNTDFDL